MNRRSFIKASGIAGSAAFIPHLLAGREIGSSPKRENAPTDDLLKGVCDIHVHRETAEDVCDLTKKAQALGYKAIMLKPTFWPVDELVTLATENLPDFQCFGGLIMTLALGNKVNFYAAEKAINNPKKRCRCIWMPTQNAAYPPTVESRHPGPTISVADADGRILPEVVRVMELCAEANIIFASGHSSPTESLEMAKLAKEVGVKKYVITHANSRIWRFTHDQVKQAVDLGAYLEYCYLPRLWGPGTYFSWMPRLSHEEFIDYVRLAPEQSFISTDLGNKHMSIEPLEGMRMCIKELIEAGVTQKEIDLLTRTNPAYLIGLTE